MFHSGSSLYVKISLHSVKNWRKLSIPIVKSIIIGHHQDFRALHPLITNLQISRDLHMSEHPLYKEIKEQFAWSRYSWLGLELTTIASSFSPQPSVHPDVLDSQRTELNIFLL